CWCCGPVSRIVRSRESVAKKGRPRLLLRTTDYGPLTKGPMLLDEPFLQDIIAHPDDEAPRLIYADWLEDEGGRDDGARAEFIRVQCELDAVGEDGPRRWQLQRRAAELLAAYRAEWARPLRELVLAEEFARGFVEGVTIGLAHFLERADEVF